MKPASVELATVLPGAVSFKEGNVSDTFRGSVLRANGTVSIAILKDITQKELANELLAFVLARGLSLPVPDALLAQADSQDLAARKGPLTVDGRRLVLASVDQEVPSVVFKYNNDVHGRTTLLSAIAAWVDLGRVYGFDAWIANVDRHAGNLLFGSAGKLWLIDHGWVLTGPGWTPKSLDAKAAYTHRLSEWLTPVMDQSTREAQAKTLGILETDLGVIDIDAAILASYANLLLTPEEVAAVRTFLKARIGEMTRLASLALGTPTLV